MKIGIVGNRGAWSTERLADVVERRTCFRLVVDLADVCMERGTMYYRGLDLRELDALMIKKIGVGYGPGHMDRLYMLAYLENKGVQMFSRPGSMLKVLDRLACTVVLRNESIPMPDLVVTENEKCAVAAIKRYGKAVLKPLFSTKARGMKIVTSECDVLEAVRDFKSSGNGVFYVQKAIDHQGRDFGIAFLGGEYVGAYARVGPTECWNTSDGGRYEKYEPSASIMDLAFRAQAPFDLDFTTVDVAITPEGPVVFEVSAFGGFRGLWEGSGLDAAEKYTDYVVARMQGVTR